MASHNSPLGTLFLVDRSESVGRASFHPSHLHACASPFTPHPFPRRRVVETPGYKKIQKSLCIWRFAGISLTPRAKEPRFFLPHRISLLKNTEPSRAQFHRKRKVETVPSHAVVRLQWISSVPLGTDPGPRPRVMKRMATARMRAPPRMARSLARDRGGRCLFREYYHVFC